MGLLLLQTEIDFVIDNEGILESHEVKNDNYEKYTNDDDVQKLINELIENDKIHIGERTEGTITFEYSYNVNTTFRVYNSPNNTDFDEYETDYLKD